VVSIAIAKVEFLSVQTFGNIDLPGRCTGTAPGARQTGATLAEQIEDEVARLYQRIRASEKNSSKPTTPTLSPWRLSKPSKNLHHGYTMMQV
jgi:hypothetical protein